MNELLWLQSWYEEQCVDNWQHFYGVKINTLDNPGWIIEIDLAETKYANQDFGTVEYNMESENDWMRCAVEDNVFKGACSPNNLIKAINIFKNWIENT